MPASAPPAMSHGTRSADPTATVLTGAAPRVRPQPEQNRALGANAVPQKLQNPEPGEVTVVI